MGLTLKVGGLRLGTMALEVIFWTAALSFAFFINMSSQAFKFAHPMFLMLFLEALLVILLINLLPNISKENYKVAITGTVCAIIFLTIALFLKGVTAGFLYYYLPVAITITMAAIVIIQPRGSVTILMAVCTFLMGEAFWNMNVNSHENVIMPGSFLRVYSLGLITMFSYYLYSKGIKVQKKLEEVNEKLRKLNAMKSDFLASISHELRTPLTSIKNASVLLKKKNEGATDIYLPAKELLQIIDINIDRQLRLINDLLDLAKVESDNLIIKRSLLDIEGIVKEAVDYLSIQAKAKNINIQIKIEPGMPKIYASWDQLVEVYMNLLDNAVKYTSQGGTVSVEVTAYNDGIKSVISDTGIGIKQDEIKNLFDKFRRLESGKKEGVEGTGLGLAISKKIIDLNSGKIWVESEFGKGSKFIFTIPRGLRKDDQL